jgi:two-component sensor histidine kinase
MIGTNTDISERKQNEQILQQSLKDKQALLMEVHHRVKNNLQVISSLLRLETRRSTHAETKTVLTDMQGRIRSMAVLHESLYRSGTFASIDLGAYLKQLATPGLPGPAVEPERDCSTSA